MPRGAARDEDRHERGGSGRSAGAADGISSQPIRAGGLARPFVGLRGGVAEAVEPLHLLLGVAPHLVPRRQYRDELANTSTQLVGEVRGRGPDERVDVVAGRLGHFAGKRTARWSPR